ncbi:MAG: hypothetical protein ACT6S0_19730 [Roseateles sp.]|uniref:hypothetical protein n=1 Tax=Roseateles sp. TaxID=1971397 RepID=UPI0040357D9B
MNIGFAIGGALSFAAALLHLAIIVGGASWYRFFGAGEGFARAAEAGHWAPALTTLGIAVVLFVAAGYAWGASGLAPALRGLPWMRPALLVVTAVYVLRGLAPLPLAWLAPAQLTPFVGWSSAVCLGFGLTHLWGWFKA